MALQFNYGDNSSGTDVQKRISPWNWSTAFREIYSQNNVGRVTDIKAPLGLDTQIKFQNTRIANVYDTLAHGSIPVINRQTNVSGMTVFTELSTVLSSPQQDGPDILVPAVARIELRLPTHPDLTDEVIEQLVADCYACLCDSTGNIDVASRLRGTVIPHEVD